VLLTLNQVISQITTLAAAHNQIAASGVGDFAEWQGEERNYPLLWVFHETTSVGNRELVFSIRLICADRVIVGEEGEDTDGMEQEVLSDTMLILLDFLSYFMQQHSQSYTVVPSATIDPFTERLNDRLAGNSVIIQIRQPFTWDACQIPQSGATIPPSVDGLTLYDFCDPSVIARLTAAQVVCLEAEYGITCADATIEINGALFDTVASGATLDIPVISEGSNPVGSLVGSDWVIENNATYINSVQVTDQEAEIDAAIFVTRDGVQNGSWNAGAQTWEVTSAACSPVALQINGTPQESIAAGATFNLIATLDGVAGGTYTPATDTLAFTSNSGWARPSFWPALPTISAATEGGNILLLVYENRLNRFTVQINNVIITWGDGTTTTTVGTPVTTKTYTYSTLSGTVYVDAQTSENYKFVTINIVRNGAAITTVDFTASAATSPLNAPSYAVEYDLSFPNCTDFRIGFASARDARFAKILKIWALGTLGGICRIGNTNNLRILQLPTTLSGNFSNNFARGMGAVPVGNINYGTAINCQTLFYFSNIVSHGNLTANSATNLSYYVADNSNIETFGTVTANTCTTIELSWYNCLALTSIGLLTLPVCTSYYAAFYNTQLTVIRFADSTACTNTASMVLLCPALQLLHCPNLTRGVNFTGTSIGNYGMNIFASGDGILNGVGTASGAQTITITGTPFGVLVTASNATALAIRLVLTTKGYTIAN
jgi:hypothetical protein